MEAVNAVSRWLQKWTASGEQECRAFVSPHHLKLTDSVSSATVFSVYQALLYATVATWTGKAKLTGSAFTNFVKSAVDGMPSTSTASPPAVDPMRATFGEHLVDIIWALDIDLDEVAAEAKAASGNSNPEVVKRGTLKAGIVEADRVTLADITRALLVAGIIDKYIAAERLEFPLLKRVNLIQDDKDSNKKEVRMRTRLFYKQNKFNLLREQSEGYSKLTTELTSSLGPPHSPATARPAEALEDVSERTKAVWDKIISIVGYFDLDPNRALDIILDVFSTHIATHHTFFLALLACSPWAGAYQSHSPKAMELDTQTPSFDGKKLEEILTLLEPATNPDTNNDQRSRVLAQVLGFKFAYYSGVEPSEVTSRNLYMTAALLIREGFITLEDLYPHLVANDTEDEGKAAYKATIEERISALRVSNLAMAAPLDSMTPPTNGRPKAAEPKSAQAQVKEPPTQTMGIIAALLTVGSVKPALWLLAKYPWMVDAFPEIADVMIRVARASVTPLYEEALKKPPNTSWLQPRARFTTTGVVPPPQRKPVLTIRAPTPPSTASIDFVFFFPDWEQSIPICTKLDDLIPIIEPLLMVIKLHVTRDLVFLTKLCRLARKHIESITPNTIQADTGKPDPNDPIRQFWYKMLRLVFIPGLSAMHGSAVINVEIWNLIKLYESSERWRLYAEWKSSIYQQHSELAVRRVEADREAKDILRRVSGTTIDVMSNAIAKLVSTNPCLFFTPAVNQIMAYDGALPDNVAKALRGITQLGYDVLNFTILEALAGSRQRVQEDGLTISPWLTRLSAFTGKLYRQYGANVESILEYIVHQLHNRSTADIEVLRALILQMTDIEPLPSLTDGQVQAMSGGPHLCIETVASEKRGASHTPDKNVVRAAERFGKALVSSKLALPLLVEVAQQRQTAVFSSPSTHLKSLAKLYDLTHSVLGQYLSVLTTSWIPLEVYANEILPPLGDLGELYGICAPICMQIYRPVLTEKILVKWVALEKQESAERERSLKEAMKAKRNATSSAASRVASPVTGKTTNEAQPAAANGTNAPAPTSAAPETAPALMDVDVPAPVLLTATAPGSPWLPELEVHFAEVKRLLPEKVYNTLGPGFYLTFWQLSMYDLTPPIVSYEQAVALLRSRAKKEDDQAREIARANRTYRTRAYLEKQDQYDKGIENLQSEMKTQCISRTCTIRRFATEKMHWFAATVTPNALLEVFHEHCLIPRCLMSPMDAEYAAQMVRAMHNAGTPGFHTMACYNMLLKDLPATIVFSCSEDEARNYGRFLRSILADLHKWHKDETAYLSDNRIKSHGKSLPGMRMRFRVDKEPILHSQFQQVLRKWHQKLVTSFTDCFKTGEYMHVYNSILVLNAMLPEFPMPTIAQHSGKTIKSTMEAFLAKETREDVSQLGASYLAGLKKEERKWPDLHHEKAAAPKDKIPTAPKEKDLNVAAAPFKPRASPVQAQSSPAHSNGNSDNKRSNGAPPTSISTPSAPRAHQSLPPRPGIQGGSKSSTEPYVRLFIVYGTLKLFSVPDIRMFLVQSLSVAEFSETLVRLHRP
ncbi:hypothetical protein CYLTODRAFT_343075 [Cylindrobasidium torrendii FP15055 ss-10]|uniref:THO complex subunit 2 n=1 Tax=Cylindrobasidium torrendii FP15055 ss-10 TaxID=1314674 RepID=A0A0D7BS33_9AGAR|nr:hypothetical protein CYLTODRAFT_343075 [Cylindrobasidium torrendii FP15055 ss-10]